jgi:hypothetical protein
MAENVVEKKGIKYWVRESRYLLLYILWTFSSDHRLSFLQTYLPEYLLSYSFSIETFVLINVLIFIITLDVPFFERVTIKPKIFFWANGVLLIGLLIMNGMIYLVELLPETDRNPLWVIYLILGVIILLGIVIGFIKRSEQLSK